MVENWPKVMNLKAGVLFEIGDDERADGDALELLYMLQDPIAQERVFIERLR